MVLNVRLFAAHNDIFSFGERPFSSAGDRALFGTVYFLSFVIFRPNCSCLLPAKILGLVLVSLLPVRTYDATH